MYLERVNQLNPDLVGQALLTPDPVIRGRIIAKFIALDENWLEDYLQERLRDGYLIDSILENANQAFRTKHRRGKL